MKAAVVLGTRPEIIKLYPIISKLRKRECTIIYSGQHYDYELGKQFMDNFDMRRPDHWVRLQDSSKNTPVNASTRTGEMICKLSPILQDVKPDTTVVQGDTNTVLAASIASLKLGIPVSHVEAGIRSFDWRMQEEHNRIVADHLGELLFAPTFIARENLSSESVHGKIHLTGNTVIDAVEEFADVSLAKSDLESVFYDSLEYFYGSKRPKEEADAESVFGDFALVTIHRAENINSKDAMTSIVGAILKSGKRVVFPVHPHTQKRLRQLGLLSRLLRSKNVFLARAVGYFDFVELMKRCSFIITDSGGIQEEATSPKIKKKVLVLRQKTDRPESVSAGFSELVGLGHSRIVSAIKRADRNPAVPSIPSYHYEKRKQRRGSSEQSRVFSSGEKNSGNSSFLSKHHYYPYGTGRASDKIIRILRKSF